MEVSAGYITKGKSLEIVGSKSSYQELFANCVKCQSTCNFALYELHVYIKCIYKFCVTYFQSEIIHVQLN